MENGKSRLQQAQDDVEEVKVIMLNNLSKAEERGDKLHDLEDRAGELLEKGKNFEKKTHQVKQKKMWENNKMKIIGAVIVALVIIIVLAIIISYCTGGSSASVSESKSEPPSQTPAP